MALRLPERLRYNALSRDAKRDTRDEAWWARGDFPARVAEALVPLVDGRAAMLAMCVAFLTAKRSIWLADWDLHVRLHMVRGRDQRAGKDGTAEQYALLNHLRDAGLDADAIRQWESNGLRVLDVLGFAARRGVDVRVLVWAPFNPGGLLHVVNDPDEQRRLLEARDVRCRLDKNSRSPFHVAQALHQKCAVVDGVTAFVGGVDLTVEHTGDFDRWDTPAHPYDSAVRATDLGPAAHPWHDVHLLVRGAPARDVERNIRQRWAEAGRDFLHRAPPPLVYLARAYLSPTRETPDEAVRAAEAGKAPPHAGPQVEGPQARVQVVRTIPALTYRFAPAGIHGIAQSYDLAMRRAERFIYLESQYLWLEGYEGVNTLRLGWQSHYMRALLTDLAQAAERGVSIALLLPDHPNVGRAFTDGGIAWLREHAPNAVAAERLRFFCLVTSTAPDERGNVRYRPIYVHAKVGIVDDHWATAGSANLNSRGVSHDAELNVTALDGDFARGLRLALWAEHLGLRDDASTGWPAPAALPLPTPLAKPSDRGLAALLRPLNPLAPCDDTTQHANTAEYTEEAAALADPCAGIALLARRAEENLERLRRGEPLRGHILPYLTHEESGECGFVVDAKRGLLAPVREDREGVRIRHIGRYT
jgi:phosphatidylserine/phosphatidylglycerophosphate/cardiolipin synthase-like enzyme